MIPAGYDPTSSPGEALGLKGCVFETAVLPRIRVRDVARLAAERHGVVAHPFERRDLIEEAQVSGRAVFSVAVLVVAEACEREDAEGAEPAVDHHHDEVAPARQRCAGVDRLGARSDRQAPAVDPDQHGPAGCVGAGRPQVEGQAVLVEDLRPRSQVALPRTPPPHPGRTLSRHPIPIRSLEMQGLCCRCIGTTAIEGLRASEGA